MSKALQWIIGIGVVLIVAAIIFSTILPFFAPRLGLTGDFDYRYGMMGPGHMFGGRGMMGGFGMPFFGIGIFLWPLLFIGLIVLGVVWLVRSVARPAVPQAPAMPMAPAAPQPPVPTAVCAHCGKPLQAGWMACPYCGEKI